MIRKNACVLSSLIFLLLVSMVLSVDNFRVSAVPLSPYIMVLPEKTVDPTIEPGRNYTISLYTDYSGNDIWAWQFNLTFNPSVLQMGFNTTDTWAGDGVAVVFNSSREAIVQYSEKIYVDQALMTRDVNYTIKYDTGQIEFTIPPSLGVEVKAEYIWTGFANGDLIAAAKNPSATFLAGAFDNTLGRLSQTNAFFFYASPATPPTTYGPGTLVYITFRVVGYGSSDIILGKDTKLVAPGPPPDYIPPTEIIDASTQPDHIGNGQFENIHDIAVVRLVTPTTVILGDRVAINVTVANGGDVIRTFNITVYANATLVGNQTVNNLAEGEMATLAFDWNTTVMSAGSYTVNATALLPPDDDPKDNTRIATTEVKTLHDVAVLSLEIPDKAIQGDLVTIKVSIANQGTFEENVNLTIYYQRRVQYPEPPTGFNTTTFTLGKRPTSTIVQTIWNTTGLDRGSYNVNATIAIDTDEDPGDNTLSKLVALNLGHDVRITIVSATPKVFVGETVTISVTVQNVGGLNETLIEVKVTCGTVAIGSQQVPSLTIGNSVTLLFVWSTAGINPQIYLIEAEAILETDLDQTNNRKAEVVVIATPVGTIAGIVKDTSTGNPIAGASVACGTYANTTNADGSYRLSNVLAGNYTVTASKTGYQASSQTSIRVVAGQTTSLDFTLTILSGRITGTVTDASTGNPIEGAQVTAGGNSVLTNATGDYIIEIAAGTYDVTVSANGYASSSEADVNVIAGAATTVDFTLKPDAPLNIFSYAAIVAVGIIVIVGTAVYLQKRKKTT